MYDEYPMIHYDLARPDGMIPVDTTDSAKIMESEKDAYSLILTADYRLRGSVDVLTFFPHPDDCFHRRMHLQSFSCMYSLSDYYTKRADTDSWLLVLTERGRGRIEYRGQSYLLEKGDLFWIDCHEESSYRTEGDFWEHTDIHIGGNGIADLYRRFAEVKKPVLRRAQIPFFKADLKVLLDAYITMDVNRTLRTSYSIETMLVHLILAEGEKESGVSNTPKLQELIQYMHGHYREPLTMDQLSQQAGFSKYHLSREFKKLTGMPPNEYLISLRIEQAKRMLASTDLPVYKIGILSGIENEAYFSRLFHQRLQMTPAEYRKRNRNV